MFCPQDPGDRMLRAEYAGVLKSYDMLVSASQVRVSTSSRESS